MKTINWYNRHTSADLLLCFSASFQMCIFRDSRRSGKPPHGADGWRQTKELENHKMTNLPARLKEITLTCSRYHDTPPPRVHRRPRYGSKEATIIITTTQIKNCQSGPYNLAADCATLSKQTNTQASLYPSRQIVSGVGKKRVCTREFQHTIGCLILSQKEIFQCICFFFCV